MINEISRKIKNFDVHEINEAIVSITKNKLPCRILLSACASLAIEVGLHENQHEGRIQLELKIKATLLDTANTNSKQPSQIKNWSYHYRSIIFQPFDIVLVYYTLSCLLLAFPYMFNTVLFLHMVIYKCALLLFLLCNFTFFCLPQTFHKKYKSIYLEKSCTLLQI